MNSRRSSGALSEADADALLSGRAVAEHDDLREIIGLMKTASAVPAPTLTAALAAVLHNGFDPLPVASAPDTSRWGRWSVRIAAVTAAAMTATLGAASANALPAPVQTAVANVIGAVTPLQLPRPAAPSENGNDDGGRPPAEPAKATMTPDTAPSGPRARVVAPRRATAPITDEKDDIEESEPDTDGPEADERDRDAPEVDAGGSETDQRDSDAPDSDALDSHRADADEPDTDQPDTDQPDTSEGDVGDHDLPTSDEDEFGGKLG